MKLFMSVKKKGRIYCSKKTQNNKDDATVSCQEIEEQKICSFCAEGAYWCEIDSKDVICPYISCLQEGNCSKFRKLK